MKKYLMLSVAILTGSVMFAQHHGGEKRREEMGEKMKTELALTDAQYAAVKAINKKYHNQYSELRKDSTRTKEEKMKTIKDLHTARQSEVNALLNAEQKQKWAALQTERRERGKARMKMASERHEARLKDELKLTDDQFVKVQAAGKAFHEKMRAAHEIQNAPSDSRKAAFDQARADYDQAMKEILSAEQYQKWLDKKAEMRKRMSEPKRRG
jgi:Spy/CpxP family protein refolding chaperone